ncbi:MurR/RpiR family transcriptional regulator [Alkalicoccobacillus murimartini]|uniref:DNA-binding MurR/RpiR family transcriptional regulator n=1 Tax=Alkalicoccobacillus murimartini TaxID=171685 RepID=A0ABT9YGA2_9BACI|nr:MurR/RpiR family transcriptional regulator [Alkalicoccobacillus murimartini]MDQ0206898.1 DNA-binding MurR/RpiR family transcriptional regulator [Alkalicoccobacillus murimartini]
MDKEPLTLLKDSVLALPDSQRKVANYIINHPTDVAFMTVDQLSSNVGTSTTTVMRLMANIGYSGYSEFQKNHQQMLREQASPQTRLEANLKSHNQSQSWTHYMERQLESIQQTATLNTEAMLNQAIEFIVSSNHIYTTSVRSGLPVAQYLVHNLNRLVGNAKFNLADSSDWVDDAVGMTKDDLLIVVSYSRYGKRIIDYARVAKEQEAKVIAITDSYSSPVVPYADLVLPCHSLGIASHNTIVPTMFMVDYLISAIALNYPNLTKDRLKDVNSILLSMNYHKE